MYATCHTRTPCSMPCPPPPAPPRLLPLLPLPPSSCPQELRKAATNMHELSLHQRDTMRQLTEERMGLDNRLAQLKVCGGWGGGRVGDLGWDGGGAGAWRGVLCVCLLPPHAVRRHLVREERCVWQSHRWRHGPRRSCALQTSPMQPAGRPVPLAPLTTTHTHTRTASALLRLMPVAACLPSSAPSGRERQDGVSAGLGAVPHAGGRHSAPLPPPPPRGIYAQLCGGDPLWSNSAEGSRCWLPWRLGRAPCPPPHVSDTPPPPPWHPHTPAPA